MREKGLHSPLLRNAVLLAVSMLLVIGFWGHAEFYKLGQIPLVLVGGLVTFFFLKVIVWAGDNTALGRRSAGTILFRPEEVKLIQYGSKRIAIRPLRKTRMRAGSVYDARLRVTSDRAFAQLLILDVYRRRLGELTEEDALAEGSGSLEELRRRWETTYHRWNPFELVRVIEFRPLRSMRMW
ncbi:MAG: ASCH domain-containing protein [Thermoplasmatota archaeon]